MTTLLKSATGTRLRLGKYPEKPYVIEAIAEDSNGNLQWFTYEFGTEPEAVNAYYRITGE